MPAIRQIAAEFRDAPLAEIEKLLESEWHEARLAGLVILAGQSAKADERGRREIYRLYLRRTDRVNNWDLVDLSAPRIVGGYLLDRPREVLRRLARSPNVWERRIAIIATLWFIRHGQFDDTLAIAEQLIDDEHDLIHKATGWALREVGKRDEAVLRRFLDRRAAALPRTALRYAIERLPATDRRRYMAVGPKRVKKARPSH